MMIRSQDHTSDDPPPLLLAMDRVIQKSSSRACVGVNRSRRLLIVPPHLLFCCWGFVLLFCVIIISISISADNADAFVLQRQRRPELLHRRVAAVHQVMVGTTVLSASLSDDDDDSTNKSADINFNNKKKIQGVTLKLAVDQQGGVADLAESISERFTCGESLDMVHRLRRDSDAVLVGRRTVEIDDCTLTVRRVSPRIIDAESMKLLQQQPVRVIVDPHQKLKNNLSKYKVATDGLESIIYYHDSDLDEERTMAMIKSSSTSSSSTAFYSSHVDETYPNVQWVGLPATSNTASTTTTKKKKTTTNSEINKQQQDGGRPPPISSFRRLSARDIVYDLQQHHQLWHIMVEGGPATAQQFLQEGMVDRIILVRAPMSFQIPAPSNLTPNDFEKAGLELIRQGTLGGVDQVEYWSRPSLPWPSSATDDNDDSSSSSSFWP